MYIITKYISRFIARRQMGYGLFVCHFFMKCFLGTVTSGLLKNTIAILSDEIWVGCKDWEFDTFLSSVIYLCDMALDNPLVYQTFPSPVQPHDILLSWFYYYLGHLGICYGSHRPISRWLADDSCSETVGSIESLFGVGSVMFDQLCTLESLFKTACTAAGGWYHMGARGFKYGSPRGNVSVQTTLSEERGANIK